jgi:hypothetical protein
VARLARGAPRGRCPDHRTPDRGPSPGRAFPGVGAPGRGDPGGPARRLAPASHGRGVGPSRRGLRGGAATCGRGPPPGLRGGARGPRGDPIVDPGGGDRMQSLSDRITPGPRPFSWPSGWRFSTSCSAAHPSWLPGPSATMACTLPSERRWPRGGIPLDLRCGRAGPSALSAWPAGGPRAPLVAGRGPCRGVSGGSFRLPAGDLDGGRSGVVGGPGATRPRSPGIAVLRPGTLPSGRLGPVLQPGRERAVVHGRLGRRPRALPRVAGSPPSDAPEPLDRSGTAIRTGGAAPNELRPPSDWVSSSPSGSSSAPRPSYLHRQSCWASSSCAPD